MKFLNTLFVIILLAIQAQGYSQDFYQNIRGSVIDSDTKQPIIGASVTVVGSDPLIGATTDVDGKFLIQNVPVGRVSLQVTAIGFEPRRLPNLIVESAKETMVKVETVESLETLKEMVVTNEVSPRESINDMAMVSSKTVTVEETGRYAGSLNDPARMVSAFAGVVGNAEGNNDIVVRGNSPRGILWRLEGVEIPNPNHFANEGSTGGPVNTLNASMLANSDFFSGAFAPEYGNALSGVFDTKFRTGNSHKAEQRFSIGVLGTDITLEGPFSKNYGGSYLVNYRYSTLELLDKAGILDFGGVPQYQDGSFKVVLPTKNSGSFTLFGLGGKSKISQEWVDEETNDIQGYSKVQDELGVIGLKHNYLLNNSSYLESYVSLSGTRNKSFNEALDESTGQFYENYVQDFNDSKTRFSTTYHNKVNKQNYFKVGGIYTLMKYNMHSTVNSDNTVPQDWMNTTGNSSMMQLYTSWKHRFNKDLEVVGGLHYTQLFLNNNYSLEPRLGMKWNYNSQNYLSLGAGLHSKIESISVYLANVEESTEQFANQDLELTKSSHFVLGYGHFFNPNLVFKSEAYFQYLYDVPVENDVNSSFSMINQSDSYINLPLVSAGTGMNYGVELTLERYFAKSYYFLTTASVYQSKYTALDNAVRDSRFNANYASNVVFGKEFQLKSQKKNKTLAVNLKGSLIGGNRYTPVDLNQSISEGKTVLSSESFSQKYPDVFFLNLGATYRINRKKVTHEVKLDIQNITNNQAVVGQYFDNTNETIVDYYQLSLIPNLMYILKF